MEVSKHLQGSTILLYGPVKIGKTATAATFPKPVFVASERGHKYIDKDIPIVTIYSSEAYKEIRNKIVGVLKKLKPKTIVVDTISEMYNVIFRYVCGEENVIHPAKKGDYGRAIWQMIRVELGKFISKIIDVAAAFDSTVIFVAHSKVVRRETASLAYEKITYDLAYQINYLLPQSVDHIWLLDFRYTEDDDATTDRVLYLKGDIYIDVETRDKSIRTKRIPLTKKGKQLNAFRRINFVFNKNHSNGK